jgi:serpin B
MTTGAKQLLAWTAIGLAGLTTATACGSASSAKAPVVRRPAEKQPAVSPPPEGGNFTFDLYKSVAAGSPQDNAVLSPLGVELVLSMVAAGAKGPTADQLARVLHHGATPDDLKALAALEDELRSRNGPGLTLDLTASEWLDKAIKLYPAYRQAIEDTMGAVPHTVDFEKDAVGATKAINADVSHVTHGKIPRLLDTVDPSTALVLVSAAYLKATWTTPFEKYDSRPADFTLLDGRVVRPMTMTHAGRYATAQGQGWRAVRLPYADGRASMLVVVPDQLTAFERSMTNATVDGIVKALGEAHGVNLSLPKFEIRTRQPLNQTLAGLGAGLVFDPDHADLTGIAPAVKGNLYLSLVQHEAWVKVDEEGTEAAAATAGVVGQASAPYAPEVFKVDRPFLFLIRDDATGAVLFLGRVTDPGVGAK